MVEGPSKGGHFPIGAPGSPDGPPGVRVKSPFGVPMPPVVAERPPPFYTPPQRPRRLPVRGLRLWAMLAGIAAGVALAAWGLVGVVGRSLETRQHIDSEADLREAIRLENGAADAGEAIKLYRKVFADPKMRPHALRHLMVRLLDSSDQTRGRTVRILDAVEPDWTQTPEAEQMNDLFMRRLHVGDEGTRQAAALGLARFGRARAIPALIDVLAVERMDHLAVRTLGQIDPNWYLTPEASDSVPSLLRALRSSAEHGRAAALMALSYCGGPSAILPIVEACVEDNHLSVALAIKLLSAIDPAWKRRPEAKKAADICIARLSQDRRRGAANAVEMLATLGDPRGLAPLIRTLVDEDLGVNERLLWNSLKRIDRNWRKSGAAIAALPRIRRRLRHHSKFARAGAALLLHEIGGLAACVDALKAPNRQARQQMERFLFTRLPTRERLLLLLHADRDVRRIARKRLDVRAHGWHRRKPAKAALPAFIDALKNPAADARNNAAWAIDLIGGTKELRTHLQRLRSGPDPKVRKYADELLKEYPLPTRR